MISNPLKSPTLFSYPKVDPPHFWTNVKDNPNLPTYWFDLYYRDRTLKYTVEIFGDRPASGFPLYIGLHGWNKNGLADNDRAWKDAAEHFFHDPIKGKNEPAVLVCPRGISSEVDHIVTDTSDFHFQPEACVLIEAMIANLLKPFPSDESLGQESGAQLSEYDELKKYQTPHLRGDIFVDPNKIVLWGFSEGADGAFQLGTRIPDRFSAVVAAAGNPRHVQFTNASNVGILLQVGEDDAFPRTTKLHEEFDFQRAQVYLEWAEKPLYDLGQALTYPDKGKYYRYECHVVQNARRSESKLDPDIPHGYWSQPDTINEKQKILAPGKDDDANKNLANFGEWLRQYDLIKPEPRWFTLDCATYQDQVINPLKSDIIKDAKRRSAPTLVAWDLDWRAPGPDEGRFHYWLYLRIPAMVADATSKIIKARIDGASLRIYTPNYFMGYLLKSESIGKPFSVFLEDDTTPIWTGTVAPKLEIERQTGLRGDPDLKFSAMICLQPGEDGTGWIVRQGRTLDELEPPPSIWCHCPVHKALVDIGIVDLMNHARIEDPSLQNGLPPKPLKKVGGGLR